MASFAVEIENLDEVIKALKSYPKVAEKRIQQAVEAGAAEVQKNAVKGVVPWRTGMLCQSFGLGITIGRMFARVTPTVEYAIYVHEGTRPHIITARPGGGLFWPGAAHPMKSVHHPGTKPNRFMPRIMERANKRIQHHFQRALDLIASDLTK